MGRSPCCEKAGLKKGPWTAEEDRLLISYVQKNGHTNWRKLPKHAGLLRCGKSCRLRWINYLRPDIKRGNFTPEEEDTIIQLHESLGNKWSEIASKLPGRTDNEIKNVWHTHLKKKLPGHSVAPKSTSRRKVRYLNDEEKSKIGTICVKESPRVSCNSDDLSSKINKNMSTSLSESFEELWQDFEAVDSPYTSSSFLGEGEWSPQALPLDLEIDYSNFLVNDGQSGLEDDMKFWYDVFLNSGGTEDLL